MADVLNLSPGEAWEQSGSAVLLLGSLYPSSADALAAVSAGAAGPAPAGGGKGAGKGAAADGAGAGGAAGGGSSNGRRLAHSPSTARRVGAPTVLAWGPELFEPLAAR
jgi:hypothetical protein